VKELPEFIPRAFTHTIEPWAVNYLSDGEPHAAE